MNHSTKNLRIPGPTPLPPQILESLTTQMVSHRSHDYEILHKRIVDSIRSYLSTSLDTILLTSSGTGGLEAAVVNFFSPGDTIVSFTCGEFGNRWADIARAFGANVIQVKFPEGSPVDPGEVASVLMKTDQVDGVFVTHNETSTGVLNPIASIAPLVHAHKDSPLLLIDSVSALGAVDLHIDDLGIDVVVSATQKAWMSPPGLAIFLISQRAYARAKEAKMPRYYFDLTMAKEFSNKNQTPATPALSVMYGLDRALQLMLSEKSDGVYQRHIHLMELLRKGIKKLGLTLLVEDEYASPTVTSIRVPEGIEASHWMKILSEEFNTEVAAGAGQLKGNIIRIAHMGFVSEEDIVLTIKALEKSLEKLR